MSTIPDLKFNKKATSLLCSKGSSIYDVTSLGGSMILWRWYTNLINKKHDDAGSHKLTKIAWRHLWTTPLLNKPVHEYCYHFKIYFKWLWCHLMNLMEYFSSSGRKKNGFVCLKNADIIFANVWRHSYSLERSFHVKKLFNAFENNQFF